MNSLISLLHDFEGFLKIEKGYSLNTIMSYTSDVRQFYNFVNTVDEINVAKLNTYLLDLKKRGYAVRTTARKIASLSTFIKFLYKNNYLKEDYSVYFDFPTERRRIPKTIKKDSVKRLLNQERIEPAYFNKNYFYRDYAMLALLYYSGLRVSEVVNLKINDLKINNKHLRVKGKGSKERLVPLPDPLLKILLKYLNICDNLDDFLFLNSQGLKVSRQTLWTILRKWVKLSGVREKVTPHVLRHSYATNLLENGVDLRYIQELLGHSNISTTEIYTSVSSKHLKESYRKAGLKY